MNAIERRHFELQQVRKDRAFNWLVIWFCLFVVLLMAVLHTSTLNWRFNRESYSVMNDRALWATIIGLAFCGICGAVCVYRIMDADEKQFMVVEDDDEPPSTGLLEFQQAHEPPAMRLESNDGNTIRLGKTKPDIGTWADLAWALYADRWRWRRDGGVKDSGIFLSLSANFADITSDMVRVGFVEGGKHKTVTREGRAWFINQHPNLFEEHMR